MALPTSWNFPPTHPDDVRGNGDAPNPIVAVRPTSDGGRARLYRNGKVDAADGSLYSLSPGFDSFEELEEWIENSPENLLRGRRVKSERLA